MKNIDKFVLFFLYNINNGLQKIVKVSKLNANSPIGFKICNISTNQDQLYAQRFQGKPVNSLALKQSKKENVAQKSNIEEKLFFKNGPAIIVLTP